MKILIIGAGGVGSYFGAKLVKAGNEVTFIARGKHLSTMLKNGLVVKSIHGDMHLENVSATDDITNCDPHDLILLATKTWQVKEVVKKINNALHKDTILITLQNGVSIREEILEHIPANHVVDGLCRIISKIEAPGVINHLGVEPKIIIGEKNGTISQRLQKVQKIFQKANINLIVSDKIDVELWNKFIFICVGGLVAVSRTTYGSVRSKSETRQLMIEVITEGYRLAKAAKIEVAADLIDTCIDFIDSLPFEATSSLCRDIWEGHPSELDYKNGAIVRLGQRYGVATPINRFIYYSLLPLEDEARNKFNSI